MTHQPKQIFAGTQVVALLEERGPGNSLVQSYSLLFVLISGVGWRGLAE
jgi:hypothetical protein